MTEFSKLIDKHIKLTRRLFCSFVKNYNGDKFNKEISEYLELDKITDYNFIIDCYYLFEDTQLAKEDFDQYGTEGPTKKPSFGEIYLRTYGILNACYMQKEALTKCMSIMGLQVSPENINTISIFDYRKIFASHTRGKVSVAVKWGQKCYG